MEKWLLIALAILSSPAFCDFQPFEKTVTCKSANDGASLRIRYDRTTHPDLGWQGTILVDVSPGSDTALTAFVRNLGFGDVARNAVIHREGIAGQVGNWVQQDTQDPIVSQVELGFTSWDLLDAKGKPSASVSGFISHLTLSKVTESGYSQGSKLGQSEYYILRFIDDYGDFLVRFEKGECHAG